MPTRAGKRRLGTFKGLAAQPFMQRTLKDEEGQEVERARLVWCQRQTRPGSSDDRRQAEVVHFMGEIAANLRGRWERLSGVEGGPVASDQEVEIDFTIIKG